MTDPSAESNLARRLHSAAGAVTGLAIGEAISRGLAAGTAKFAVLDLAVDVSSKPLERTLGPASLAALQVESVPSGDVQSDGVAAPAERLGHAVARGIAGDHESYADGDPVARSVRDLVSRCMSGSSLADAAENAGRSPVRDVGVALDIVLGAAGFADAMARAASVPGDGFVLELVGAFAGLEFGPQRIPSMWTTYVEGAHLGRRLILDDLQDHAGRLVRFTPPGPEPVLAPIGPHRTRSGIWVSNRSGAAASPPEWAVISLCRVGTLLEAHAQRRAPLLIDNWSAWNPGGREIVLEVLDTIQAYVDQGAEVLVHCAYGASRTGLILRAWMCRSSGMTPQAATAAACDDWPYVHVRNTYFNELLEDLYREGLLG